jgi:drug/metabolite transporter superfamily protein YnfA
MWKVSEEKEMPNFMDIFGSIYCLLGFPAVIFGSMFFMPTRHYHTI